MSDMKLLFIDTETTGLDPVDNDVIEVAFIADIAGKEVCKAKFNCQPHRWDTISEEALAVNHLSIAKLRTFVDPLTACDRLILVLSAHLDLHDRKDRFVIVAHNAKFDYEMMKQWFAKCGRAEMFDKLFSYHTLDTVAIAMFFAYAGPLKGKVSSFRLGALTNFFGIKFDGEAHTADADIKATKALFEVFTDFFEQ